ncbi:MAG: RNA pseudouridine synthase, partial [Victivallales bacterium]
LRIMNEIIKNREVEKIYIAAAHGLFDDKKGEMVSYLEKNADENKVYIKKAPSKGALTAILAYEVIAENRQKNLSLLKIILKTGRTHQIRAQLAEAGHPLVGDGKYSVNKEDRKSGFSSQALCSWSVKFKFASDKGLLNYLDGVTVKTEKPDFTRLFY